MALKWLDFKITNRCNNKCIYCGRQDPLNAPEKIPSYNISSTLEDALDLHFTHFAFLGGEPTIRENIQNIFLPLAKADYEIENVMAITNMLQYNENLYIEIFSARSKIAQIVASVDSLEQPNYKNQNIEDVLSNLNKIVQISKKYEHMGDRGVHVHSVISRENYLELYNIISYFKRMNIEVSMALVEPFSIVEQPLKYNEFSLQDLDLIIKQLNQMEVDGILNWANNVLREYIIKYYGLCEYGIDKCNAGINHVIIESDGNVYPCLTESYRNGLKYGNINEERFKNIYIRMKKFKCESEFNQTCWDHFLWNKLELINT